MKTNFSPWRPVRRLLAALLLTGPLAGPALAQTPTFASPVLYGAGGNAQGIVSADFNGDGRPDLATANSSNLTVGVLLQSAATPGTFTAVTTYPSGSSSFAVVLAAGDLNADGRPDLAVANQGEGTVGVLLNSATTPGTFAAAVSYSTGTTTFVRGVGIADVNGDGRLDLVASGGSLVSILLQSATTPGTFTAAVTYPTNSGSSADELVVADVNGDGRPDVLSASFGNTVSVLLNSATTPGTFGTATNYPLDGGSPFGRGLAVGDLNNDGQPDIAVANGINNTISVLLNSATTPGTFPTTVNYAAGASGPLGITIGDLNGDGLAEIVSENYSFGSGNTLSLLVNSSSTPGTFPTAPVVYGTGGAGPIHAVIRDLNADRRPDLAVSNLISQNVGVLLNTTIFAAPTLTSLSPPSGLVGTSVTLTGTNLSGATGVSFNGTAASFTVVNATAITATVPAGASSGPVTVTTPGGPSNGLAFAVTTGAPTLTTPYGDLPNNGTPPFSGTAPAGSTVTIYLTPSGGTTQVLATVPATASGAFSYTPATALASGSYSAYATAQSSNLGVSAPGNTISFTLDSTPPTVLSFTRQDPTATLTNASSVTFRIIFSEDVMRVQNGLNVTTTGSLGYPGVSVRTLSASAYDVTLSSLSGSGTLTLSLAPFIADLAGNGLASTGPLSQFYTIDRIAPTATVSTTAGSTTSTAPIPFAVTFSEPVTGFGAAGIDVRNGTITGSTVSGSGSGPYTFGVTPTSSGSVTVSVNGSAQDAAGNRSSPSNVVSVTYAPGTNTTWTGTVSTDWFTAANWTADVPTATSDATVPASAIFQPTISSGTATARALTLNSGSRLTMSGGTLDVRGDLIANGTFVPTGGTVVLGTTALSNGPTIQGSSRVRFWNLTVNANGVLLSTSIGASVRRVLTLSGAFVTQGNEFVLESDATGTALVVNSTAAGFVFGTTTVQRYIDPSRNPGPGYRHYSSPVGGATVGSLATTARGGSFTPVVNSTYNTSAAPGSVSPFPTIYGYDEQRVNLANNLSTFDKGYFSPAALSDPLAVGRGYTVNIGAGELVSLQGPLNNGSLTVSLTSTRDANPGGGWQLLGNPYPAPLNLALIADADRAGLDAATYIYSSTSQYGGQYRAYVNGAGSGNPVVPVAQGFFMRVSPGRTAASLTFRNSQRLTAFDNTAFQRPAETRPLVQLSLQGVGSNLTDETTVYFEAGATAAVEPQYDAVKLANPSGLNLATRAGSEQLAIAGQEPLGAAPRVLPLVLEVPALGSYTLTASQLLNLSGVPVYLRDLRSGAVIDLAQQPSYAFTVSSVAALAGRFELVFSPQQALATAPAALAEQVSLYPNPARGQVTLELPASLGSQATAATLIDALGRPVRTLALPAQGITAHQLDLRALPSGVYALRLSTSAGTVVKKLTLE